MSNERDRSSSPSGSHGPRRRPNPLSTALARLRDDPVLFGPFLLVGILLAVVDRLHRRDPIPTVERLGGGTSGTDVRVEFLGYPTGIGRTVRPLESLIGLEPLYLGWGLALYVLPLVAISVAGAVTMGRAMGRSVGLEPVGSLLGFVVAADLFHRLVGSIDALQGMELWGLVPLALYFYLLVRLFLVPGLLVAGRSLRGAVRESVRRTAGRGWPLFGLVLAIGLAAWLLAMAPLGAVLSSALVAPVHAVAIVVVLERDRRGGDSRRSPDAAG